MAHIYTLNGVEYPSVTTVIHCLGSERVLQWANFIGFKHQSMTAELKRTGALGTAAHERCRCVIDPSAPAPNPFNGNINDVIKLSNIVKTFTVNNEKEFHIKPIYTEYQVISSTYGVGGTIDVYGDITIKGVRYQNCVIDFKTSSQPHDTMWLQTGGYTKLLEEKGFAVEHNIILRLHEKGNPVSIIHRDLIEAYGNSFLQLNEFYKFWKDHMD